MLTYNINICILRDAYSWIRGTRLNTRSPIEERGSRFMRQRGIDFFSIRPGFNRFDAVDCGFHGKLRDNRWTSKWSFASRRLVKVRIKTRIIYKSSISSIVGIRMIFFFFTAFEISSLKIDKIDDNWIIRFDWFF